MNVCVISGQLTQSYALTAKTCGSFTKMSSSVELQPALSSFKSKVCKDFGFKVLYDAQGVRDVVKEIVICRHCFSELQCVSRIVSWHLYWDTGMYHILRKCSPSYYSKKDLPFYQALLQWLNPVLKSLVILAIWLARRGDRTIFCSKSHLFLGQWELDSKTKHPIGFQG